MIRFVPIPNAPADRDIDIRGLEVADGETFRWGGVYHSDLNTRDTLFTHLNVFEHFHPKVPAEFRNTPFVFLGNIHPDLQLQVLDQIERPRMVGLDTMNFWIGSDFRRVRRNDTPSSFPEVNVNASALRVRSR